MDSEKPGESRTPGTPPPDHFLGSGLIDLLGRAGRRVGRELGFHGHDSAGASVPRKPPGAPPGIEHDARADTPPEPGEVSIDCLDYAPDHLEKTVVEDLETFFASPRPEWCQVRWLNVHGLHPYVIKQLKDHFRFHTLAAEDVLNTHQRPKLEDYADHLFLTLRMMTAEKDQLSNEQISVFFYRDQVITFQEKAGDVWGPIRKRLENPAARLRSQGSGYLLYAMLDAVVDHCFPILESYGDLLEDLEHHVIADPIPPVQRRIHGVKRELVMLRRNIWPLRDVLSALERDEGDFFTSYVRTYLRDVYDHTVQVIDIVETYREMAGGLNDLYMSSVGNRMNEIMKVLTIMASFFIPITFVAGVYGMNFEHIPELEWQYSYAVFWMVCLSMVGGLVVYFRRKGWIGGQG